LRAIRVFRDVASLPVDADLRAVIERALGQTAFFLLLASPEAARSRYVLGEIRYWLARRPHEGFLLALTDGELVWDEAAGDFDWAELAGAFAREPRYLDLRWARDVAHLSLDDPRFPDAVAEIASKLHGRAKDDLIGEDVREHKRTMWIARSAAAVLVALAAGAATLAVLAIDQRNQARSQRDLAVSRQVAAESAAALRENHTLHCRGRLAEHDHVAELASDQRELQR
jgi:hypothetical protein